MLLCFFFQAEDGIRDLVRSRGLGDVYKRQDTGIRKNRSTGEGNAKRRPAQRPYYCVDRRPVGRCLLYTSDAADERSSVDLGGRRIIKQKKNREKIRDGELSSNTYNR